MVSEIIDKARAVTNLEVRREVLEGVPRDWDALDDGVPLLLQVQDSFVEKHAFVLASKHAHQAFHEVLCGENVREQACFTTERANMTHPDFFPHVVVAFQHREMMLKRNNETVSRYELLKLCATEVAASAQSDNGCSRKRGIVVRWTELT